MRGKQGVFKNAGFSLAEIVMGLLLFSVAGVVVARFFEKSALSQMALRNSAVAVALLQGRFETMKSIPFGSVAVSTALTPIPELPSFAYDAVNFPREEKAVNRTAFSLYLRVDRVGIDGSNTIAVLPPSASETGIKRVTGAVCWREAGRVKTHQRSQLINRSLEGVEAIPSPTVYEGFVRSTDGVPLAGAMVCLGNVYGTETKGDGSYLAEGPVFSVSSIASFMALRSHDYTYGPTYMGYSNTVVISSQSSPMRVDFNLQRNGKRDFFIPLWKNRSLKISNVVGKVVVSSTEYEWVAVVNLSTSVWDVRNMGLMFQRAPGSSGTGVDPAPIPIDLNYYNVPAKGYDIIPGAFAIFSNKYSFASTLLMNPAGNAYWNVTRTTTNLANFGPTARRVGNAVFRSTNPNIIPVYEDDYTTNHEGVGSIILYDRRNNEILDTFGWSGSGAAPGQKEGTPFSDGVAEGLRTGDRLVRYSYPGQINVMAYPVWDSNNNFTDFGRSTAAVAVKDTNQYGGLFLVGEAGLAATGTVHVIGEGQDYDAPVLMSSTTPPFPYALAKDMVFEFMVAGMREGGLFWGPVYHYNDSFRQNGCLRDPFFDVNQTDCRAMFPGHTYMGNGPLYFYKAQFRMASGAPFPGFLRNPLPQFYTTTYPRPARYFCQNNLTTKEILLVSSHPYTPAKFLFSFTHQHTSTVSFVTVDLNEGLNVVTLPEANTLQGNVVDAGGSGVANVVLNVESTVTDWEAPGITDINGEFRIHVPSNAIYKITPISASGSFSPESFTRLVTGPGETPTTTFQFSPGGGEEGGGGAAGDLGAISGIVRSGGGPIPSPVGLLVTTCAVTDMPVINQALRAGSAKYYTGTNKEDGTFTIDVPPGTGYFLYGWHAPTFGSAPVMKKVGPINVPLETEVTGVDLSW